MRLTEINITRADALRLLQEAVEVKGADYVYENPEDAYGGMSACLYTDKDSRPSCIVGHALANAGVPIEVLHAIDWGGAVALEYAEDHDDEVDGYVPNENDMVEIVRKTGLEESGISDNDTLYWLKHEGITIDEAALDMFQVAQREQDWGYTWGKSVENAISHAGRNGR